jgi:hypothetical protein
VWNSLLQILEDGRLTDGQGHVVDFRNTVIIMTSNIGTGFVKSGGTLGFIRQDSLSAQDRQLRDNIERDLKQTFRPEFLNRVDEVIVFHSLTQEHVRHIVDLQMREIAGRLAEHEVKIELTEAARDWLAQEGYDPQFGARPVRRTLERYVENPLARRLLAGEFHDGDTSSWMPWRMSRASCNCVRGPPAGAHRRRAAGPPRSKGLKAGSCILGSTFRAGCGRGHHEYANVSATTHTIRVFVPSAAAPFAYWQWPLPASSFRLLASSHRDRNLRADAHVVLQQGQVRREAGRAG